MRISPYIFLISFFAVTSCMVGPDFEKPGNNLPSSWLNNAPPHSSIKDLGAWWEIFGDSQLSYLISRASADNPDMRMALLRVREARSSAKIAGSALLPSAGTGFGVSRTSVDGLTDTSSTGHFSHSADVSWEMDVFGGNRRAIEAAEASLLSTEANAVAVRTSLFAEVATMYFSWIANCEQLRVSQEQLVLQRRTLSIVEKRHDAGFEAGLDVQQARSQVASTQSTIPLMEANKKSSQNSLAILLGSYMSDFSLKLPKSDVFGRMPEIPVGVPSDLLRRRPDIIGAEADLHAAVAEVGVAVADLYPKFSLTGSISNGSKKFYDLYKNSSGAWSLGGSMTQALYKGGALRERVKMSKTAAERFLESYRKILIASVGEVEQALIDYASFRERLVSIEKENEANKKAAEYALLLYTEGQTDFLNVASSQRAWLGSEESIVTMKQNIRKAVVQLALALGGGW